MSIFSTSSLHIGKMKLFFKVLRRNYCDMALDQTLSGETTANSVISKCNSRLKFLYHKDNYFDFTSIRNLTMAPIQCHFDYACSAWYGGLKLKLKQRLQICQNKMIRYVLGLHHIGYNEFKIVNGLPVEKRVPQLNVNHMLKFFNNTAPSYLSEQFEHVQNQNHYLRRGSSHNFIVPGVNSAGRYSFLGGGGGGMGHSGTERGLTLVTYFADTGVFFKTSACPRFCKRRVLFCTQVRSMGGENPLTIHEIKRL